MADFVFTLAKESNVYDIKGGILGVSDIDGKLEFWIAGNENGEIHAVSFNAYIREQDHDKSRIPRLQGDNSDCLRHVYLRVIPGSRIHMVSNSPLYSRLSTLRYIAKYH
jgi:hypothetical protein